MGSVGNTYGAVAAEPFCVRIAAVAGCQETLAVTPRTFPLCSNNLQPALQTVCLAVLFRSADPVEQYVVKTELEIHFPLPVRARETRPVRLAHYRDDTT